MRRHSAPSGPGGSRSAGGQSLSSSRSGAVPASRCAKAARRGEAGGRGVGGRPGGDPLQVKRRDAAGDDRVADAAAQRPHPRIGLGQAGGDGPHVTGGPVVDDVDKRQRGHARDVGERLHRDQPPRDRGSDERVDDDRLPAGRRLPGDERAPLGVAHVQPRRPAQAQVLAGQREHVGVDLAHLLTPAGILGRQRAGQCAGASADVKDPAGMSGAQDDPDPAQVVELQVQRIGEVDVGGVHVALAQQPARWAPRVALGDEITAPRDRLGCAAGRGHGAQCRSWTQVSDPRLTAPAAAIRLTATNIRMSVIGSWMAPPSAAPAESVSWEMLVTVVITWARAVGGA